MIIDTTPTKIVGSFHKCCSCGHVVGGGDGTGRKIPRQCSCEKKVLAYYPECPGCHGFTSHCRFCTNSGYGCGEYKYRNDYVSKYDSRGWISSFLRRMRLEGLLSEEVLGKALAILFKDSPQGRATNVYRRWV